jgi:hypothetical protein
VSNNAWGSTLFSAHAAGPTLTAAAAASALIASSPSAGQLRTTIPSGTFKEGDRLLYTASGVISYAASTPGSITLDLRLGSTVVFSSGAMPLPTAGATNANWDLAVDISIRAVGATTSAILWGSGRFFVQALSGAQGSSPLGFLLPYGTAQAASSGFDSTVANVFDSYFTQTVATGSFTLQQAKLDYLT